jgi:hypothetical protein
MKAFCLGMLLPATLAIVSCEMVNQPITSSSFDPLVTPGGGVKTDNPTFGPELSPGSFVTATIPNTAFYRNKPKAGEDASKLLTQGTNMKIVSPESDFVQVELDSGEVGWVPAVMISSGMSATETFPTDGTYQVYPPLPDTGPIEPLPPIDAGGLPPEGAIPAIIDPDAPVPAPGDPIKIDPVPELKPATPEENPVAQGDDAEKVADEEDKENKENETDSAAE